VVHTYIPSQLTTPLQPERIQGAQYTVKSDVWSLGISLIELALGRFPFADDDIAGSDSDLSDLEGTLSPGSIPQPRKKKELTPEEKEAKRKRDRRKSKGVSLQGGGMTMSILELLQHIVNEPAPRLTPEGRFPLEAHEFVEKCLLKDPETRWTPKQLLVSAMQTFVFDVADVTGRNTRGVCMLARLTLTSRSGQARSERVLVVGGSFD
jgi:mitogen-activated protein kinase kinase